MCIHAETVYRGEDKAGFITANGRCDACSGLEHTELYPGTSIHYASECKARQGNLFQHHIPTVRRDELGSLPHKLYFNRRVACLS
jgi:hypothetical protein